MSENINQDVAISGERNIVVGKGDVIINPLPPAEARLRHDLGILLKNVETIWVKGVLEKSVHQATLLELGMETRVEAVDNPWGMVLEAPDKPRETLPQGTRIKDVFYESNGLLLILGEPGSGKTTTLLQLARDLIAEVDQAFTQPVPVILNLSTWTDKQQPFNEWLVEEMNNKYRLPRKQGQRWLEEQRIVLLLDGLDEVKPENRGACVEKINQLITDYGLHGLVVCSRIKDYSDLNVRLAFYGAIYLQLLTHGQLDEYFDRAGDKLASLRDVLKHDDALQSLSQSPLMLNIMSLAYQDVSAKDLADLVLNSDKTRRKHLFDTYIARMLNRKIRRREYDNEQTKQHLSWLARAMQGHNQDVFLIENFQPSWLFERSWKLIYVFTSRLIASAVVLTAFGSLFPSTITWDGYPSYIFQILEIVKWILIGVSLGIIDIFRLERNREQIYNTNVARVREMAMSIAIVSITVGIIYFLIDGFLISVLSVTWGVPSLQYILPIIIFSLFLSLIVVNRFENLRKQSKEVNTNMAWKRVINIAIVGLIAGFIFLISYMVMYGFYLNDYKIYNIVPAMFFGLFFGWRGNERTLKNDIQAVEVLRWSWRKSFWGGLVIGLMALMGFVIIVGLGPDIDNEAILAILLVLIFGLIGGVFSGLSTEIIKAKSTPNQGMWLSTRNATISGFVVALISWFSTGVSLLLALLVFEPNEVPNATISEFIQVMFIDTSSIPVMLGFLVAFWYGGLDVMQHYILRMILVMQGHTPLNYSRLLDYAVDRIFFQKVGGGYRFIHRLLLEHFADMGATKKA